MLVELPDSISPMDYQTKLKDLQKQIETLPTGDAPAGEYQDLPADLGGAFVDPAGYIGRDRNTGRNAIRDELYVGRHVGHGGGFGCVHALIVSPDSALSTPVGSDSRMQEEDELVVALPGKDRTPPPRFARPGGAAVCTGPLLSGCHADEPPPAA